MSHPIQGYEPGPEGSDTSKRFQVYVDKEFLHAFREEWEACQYMDEQALASQADANRLGESFLFSVIEDGSVVATHPIHPAASEFVRQVFDRGTIAPRPRLDVDSDLSVREQLGRARPSRKLLRLRK